MTSLMEGPSVCKEIFLIIFNRWSKFQRSCNFYGPQQKVYFLIFYATLRNKTIFFANLCIPIFHIQLAVKYGRGVEKVFSSKVFFFFLRKHFWPIFSTQSNFEQKEPTFPSNFKPSFTSTLLWENIEGYKTLASLQIYRKKVVPRQCGSVI